MKLLTGLLAASLFLFCCPALFGSSLVATVWTPDGKPAPGVSIVVTNLDTGQKHEGKTDEQGHLSLELPEGDYAVALGPPLGADPAVPPDQTVHLVMTAERDREVGLELIRDLARGLTRLQLRQPAETRLAAGRGTATEDAELAAIRDYEAFLSDDPNARAETRRTLPELINPFAAGRRGKYHGSLYEFHRNDNFDARNFFDPLGEPLPEYKRNQFGFSLGVSLSPQLQILGSYDGLRIIQGSTLLSHVPTTAMKEGDFAGLLGAASPVTLRDPYTGEAFADNRIPPGRIHAVAARLLTLLPDPNRLDPDRNYVNNQPLVHNQDALTLKVDQQLGASKLTADYNRRKSQAIRPQALPSFGSTESAHNQDFSLGLNHNFTQRVMVESRQSFVRSRTSRYSHNSGRSGLLESVGIAGVSVADPQEEGYPEFEISGYADPGDQASPVTSVFNGFFTDLTLTYALDSHTVLMGTEFDFREYNDYRSGGSQRGRFVFNGYYAGDAFADFLLGIPDSASRAIGSDRADLRGSNWQFFIRDTWKINPLFSFSSSLTYNYFPPFRSVQDNVSGFYPLLLEPPLGGELVIAGSDRAWQLGLPETSGSMVHADRNNWAPRIGLAYNPSGTNRLVLRAGYGVAYDPTGPHYFLNYLGHNYPFYYVESTQSSVSFPSIDLANPFAAAAAVELNVRGIDPGLRTSYYQDWQLSIGGEVKKDWSFQAAYEGNKGTRVIRVLPANIPLPAEGSYQSRRPNPSFGRFSIVANAGSFSGNALDLAAERRFSGGFSMQSGFRWTRMFSDGFPGSPNNIRDLRAERAPLGYQPTRSFSLRYILDLPFGPGRLFASNPRAVWLQWLTGGWRLSGITHLQDGSRFTPVLAGDLNNDGLGGERPDRIGSGALPGAQRSIDRWFATEDFLQPGPYSFGNSGQNILAASAYQNWDVSIVKQTRFHDGDLVELRIELFNAFNQVNFDEPAAVLDNSTFGKIFGAGRAREIEVAVKYTF